MGFKIVATGKCANCPYQKLNLESVAIQTFNLNRRTLMTDISCEYEEICEMWQKRLEKVAEAKENNG